MKRIFVMVLCIALLLAYMPALEVSAATSFTVNCSDVLRGVTHCASGSLYGVTETKPADVNNLIAPLRPGVFTNPARAGNGYQQPIGAALPVAKRISGTTGKVMIRLADIFRGWPYQYTNITDFKNKIKAVIDEKKASGLNNYYGYEIWNEPDGTWQTKNGSFEAMWKEVYNFIRANDPSAKIIGPAYSYYNSSRMSSFMSYCKNNNCVPDIICWHELSGGPKTIPSNIKNYRSIEASLGISPRPISINEYCDPTHELEGQPGSSARFIAKFEREKVDSACITWWFTAYPGRLGSLLATDTQKGAGWYFYKWYGDMSGNMVRVSSPNDTNDNVDGAACVDSNAKYISFIFGGPNDGTINAVFKNIPSFIGSTATVKVEKVDWKSKDTVCNGTTTISNSNYNVSNGQISVNVTGCNASSGYRIYITSANGSSTPTPPPTKKNAYSKLEIESYDEVNSSTITEIGTPNGGKGIGYIENGNSVVFKSVDFGSGASSFKALVATNISTSFSIRLNSASGTEVGTLQVPTTGGWDTYEEKSCTINTVTGVNDVYLVFSGPVNIDWFTFGTGSVQTPSPSKPGDVDGDGQVNSIDFGTLRMYLLGIMDKVPNPAGADIDKDGNINSIDFGLLRKNLLGMN